ncbi:MAG: DUF4345 domain-containing protein [Sandaracinaceae bacterium]
MMHVSRAFLALAGLIASGIGLSLLLDPVGFEASTGLQLPSDPQLLSELRAPGAALAVAGIFMALGAARRRFTRSALALAAGLYASYGLARLVGLALDGGAVAAVMTAATVELVMGAAAIGRLVSTAHRDHQAADGVGPRGHRAPASPGAP